MVKSCPCPAGSKNITKALEKADPDNKDYYEKNRDAFLQKLQDLEQEYKSTLKDVPKKSSLHSMQHSDI